MKVTRSHIKPMFVITISALILSINDFNVWIRGFVIGTCITTIIWYKYRINLPKLNKKPSYCIFLTLNILAQSFFSVYLLLLPIILLQLFVNQEYSYTQALVGNFELLMVKLSLLIKNTDLSKFGIVSLVLLIFAIFLTYFLSSRKILIFIKITGFLNLIVFLLFFISSFSFLGKKSLENIEKQWVIKSSAEIRNLISQLEDKHHKILVYQYLQKEISTKEDFWQIIASSLVLGKATDIYLKQYDLHVTKKELLKINNYIRTLKANQHNSEVEKFNEIKKLGNFFEELQFRELQRKMYIQRISERIDTKVSIYEPSLEIIVNELDKNSLEILTKDKFNNLFSGKYNPDEIVKQINILRVNVDSKADIEKQRYELFKNTLANIASQSLPSVNIIEVQSFIEKIIDLASETKINFVDKKGKSIQYNFIIERIDIESNYGFKVNNFNNAYQIDNYDLKVIDIEIQKLKSSILAQAKIDAELNSNKLLHNENLDKSIFQQKNKIFDDTQESFWEKFKKGKIKIKI